MHLRFYTPFAPLVLQIQGSVESIQLTYKVSDPCILPLLRSFVFGIRFVLLGLKTLSYTKIPEIYVKPNVVLFNKHHEIIILI